jgi:hypothetical protein
MSIFYHASQLWLQMVANGCKWVANGMKKEMQILPVLRQKILLDPADGLL